MTFDEADSKELMTTVLEHYLKHHKLVLKKLMLAQQATQISLENMEQLFEKQHSEELSDVWGEIISIFADCGVSEDELFTIEDILGGVPKSIKEPYENLLRQDEEVQNLLSGIDRGKYEQAVNMIEVVQSKPNPMSGLTSRDYKGKDEGGDNAFGAIRYQPRLPRKG